MGSSLGRSRHLEEAFSMDLDFDGNHSMEFLGPNY